ncbi:MAG: radical SAM protein, partial [Candidatus Methanofastidiosia archaeon]
MDVITQLLHFHGNLYSTNLNIKPREEPFKWLLASVLYGIPIQENVVGKTYKVFETRHITTPERILQAGWHELVDILDEGGCTRYDYRTADKLLEMAQSVKEKGIPYTRKGIINLAKGIGDVTATMVDKEVIELLQGTAFPENGSIMEFLKERGHLTDLTPADELRLIEDMYQEYITSYRQFYYHMIIPTYNCNLACGYCFLSDLLSKGKEWLNTVLDDSHIDRIFEVITEIDGSNRRRITLYGGEPLLPKNKSLIEKILKRGKGHGYAFTVLTNGVSLCDFLDVFRKYPIYLVQVTIDG